MGLSNAERQRRFRDRRKEQRPRIHYRRPQDRRSRPQRWRDAVQTLVDLQAEYRGLVRQPACESPGVVARRTPGRRSASTTSAIWRPWSRRVVSGVTERRRAT